MSRFFGIVIRMFFGDHLPPHFHAVYGDDEAVFAIPEQRLLYGRLPPRAVGLVLEWALAHREELLVDWERVRRGEQPHPIAPLR